MCMKQNADSPSASFDFREPRIFLILFTVLLVAVLLFYCITSMVTSVGYQTFAEAEHPAGLLEGESFALTIILDAGHGGEDPGAVANGLDEKVLNLSITNKIAEFLKLSGYNVVLTRSDDRLLYNSGEENRKKYYDLYNRLKFAETFSDAIFISIHMNKFPMESCKGLQTFYSMNDPRSAVLAEALQSASTLVMPDNRRTIKSDNRTIFLLKNLQIPAVIVECGFLSNSQDAHNLADAEYQDKLAFALASGIGQYCEKIQEEKRS